jgi:hypothetical protein
MTFLSVADEFEREARVQRVYGESPDWIRRVLQAYQNTEEYRWRILLRQATQGSRADIPLGTTVSTTNAQQPSSAGLPALVTGTATASVPQVPGQVNSQQAPPVQAVIPNPTYQTEQTMDLGSIITTLGGAYIQARYGQPQYPYMGTPQSFNQYGYIRPVADTYGVQPMPALLPAIPGMVGAATGVGSKIAAAIGGLGLGLAAEEIALIAGAASKVKCRRRRRRLATHSDIKDLAALKAVLGSGKAFDTWIATRKM